MDAMFANKTNEWQRFVATGCFSDMRHNSYMLMRYTCSHDSMTQIVKELLVTCGWMDLLKPPQTILLHGSRGIPSLSYTFYEVIDEVDDYVDALFPNPIAFPYDTHQHTTGRVSWVHKDKSTLIIERFVRIFTIDDILIDLENADI